MKANKLPAVMFLAVLTAVIILSLKETPEPGIPIEEPKQKHHVIYVSMCGVLEGIIITTDPIQFADYKTPMTPEMIELEQEALVDGRFLSFIAGLWVRCGTPEPPNLEVIEGLE